MAAQITSTRQSVYSANLGAELIVSQCGWTREQEARFGIDAIIAGEVAVDRFIATQDGRRVMMEWERDGGCGREVYYERAEGGRIVAHGWVDAESRKIVQAG